MVSEGNATAFEVIEYLKTLSPSGVELEFISLASFEFTGLDSGKQLSNPNLLLTKMLQIFDEVVKANREADFVHALLNNFLQSHHDIIIEDQDLSHQLSAMREALEIQFSQVENLVSSNLCMTSYFSGINQF
jgi:3-dehydroquinate dehydratase